MSQLLKINSALELVNVEMMIIETKCNEFDGPDCDGILPKCDSKCKTCSISPSQCTSCYGNFDGVTCSVCKSGWNGLNCTTPICDSKCLNCSSPGNCATCSGKWNGETCSTCKSGWTGSDCNSIDKTGDISSSTILTSATHLNRFLNEIMNGVSLQSASQPTLLFRASRDGFLTSTFHSKCDNKGATIVIVKSQSGAIFGGYTSKSWTSNNGDFVSDPSAFLFSLISSTGTERFTTFTQQNGWSYKNGYGYSYSNFHNSLYGPTFGGGHDLHIVNNANTVTSSYSNLCRSYCDTIMT